MKQTTLFLAFFLLISCDHREKTDQNVETGNDLSSEVTQVVKKSAGSAKVDQGKATFKKIAGKAVLLGTDIQLLGEDYKAVKDISSLSGQFVEITEVGNDFNKQKPEDDICTSFKYVKIKTKDFEGIVDGRKVYQLVQGEQGMSKNIDGNGVTLTATKNFGMDVFDEEGLTGCSIQTPAVFSDEKTGFIGLVKMKKNKFCDSDYPYFELRNDEGAGDQVKNIEKQGADYLLTIKTVYQEGGAILSVRIYRESNGDYKAEILKEERTEEY